MFYDTYSVILDMMQNHMTEILTLLAMHLPREATPANILKAKADVLNHVCSLALPTVAPWHPPSFASALNSTHPTALPRNHRCRTSRPPT